MRFSWSMHMKHIVTILVLCLSCVQFVSGQERMKVEILNADEGKLDPKISNAQRFLGNVKLKYNETIMTCDSAYRSSTCSYNISRVL